jgi:multisubunit Na+/H+ antiporter MnhB subunit
VSFIAGLVFAGMAVAYVIGAYTDFRLDPRLALPIALVGVGLAGLAASLLAQRRSDRRIDETESVTS